MPVLEQQPSQDEKRKQPDADPWGEPELPPTDIEVLPWLDEIGNRSKPPMQKDVYTHYKAATFAFMTPEALEESENRYRASRQPADKMRAAYTPGVGALGLNPPNISVANGGGVIGDFADIFGQPSRLGRDGVTDEGLRDAEIPNREQSYSDLMRDQTERLNTQINHFIRLDASLYTAQNGGLAPLQRINSTSITYDELIFDTQVIPPTPELAPTRFLGYRRKAYQHAFVRRGIGIRGTTDFMKSAPGRALVVEQLVQILNSIHETLAFGVIYSILTCNHVQRQQIRKWRRFRDDRAMYDLLSDERQRWDMLKYEKGIHKWNAICDKRLGEVRGEANTILLAPDATGFIALEHKTNTDASVSGERLALGSRNDSMDAVKMWMTTNVVVIRTFSVDNGPTQNPLQFRAQIGEYYRLLNTQHGNYTPGTVFDPKATAVEIYDETDDRWAMFDMPMCIDNCIVFDRDTGRPQRGPAASLQTRERNTLGAVRTWDDVPQAFYDEMTGLPWPHMASLLYSSCHGELGLYRMFAQSMIQAIRQGTLGRLVMDDVAGAVAVVNVGQNADADAATLGGILSAGTITGFPQPATSNALLLGNATTAESPVGFVNGATTPKWFGGRTELTPAGGPDKRMWLYSGTSLAPPFAATLPLVANPGAGASHISDVLNAKWAYMQSPVGGPYPAETIGQNSIPHLAQVMLDTVSLSAIEQVALRVFGAMPFNASVAKALHAAGVILPFTCLLMRPHAEYNTLTSVKMMAGLPTAATYIRDGLFEMGSDPVIGEVAGKFTFHSRTVIMKPNNVCVTDNIFVNGYIGGMNAGFIKTAPSREADYLPSAGLYGTEHTRANDPNMYNQRNRPSVYAFLVPYGWAHSTKVSNPISMHGALHVDLSDQRPSIMVQGSRQFSFPGLSWYEDKFHFRQRIVPTPDIFSQEIINSIVATNAVCWEGHTRRYDPKSQAFGLDNFTQPGTGHWGKDNTYIGCNDFRQGIFSKQKVGT